MTVSLDQWDTVIAFPIVPFRQGRIDPDGFARNVEYLIANNWLDHGRRRGIALGGSSLIHHIPASDQLRLAWVLCEIAGGRALVLSGILPNPLAIASELITRQCEFPRRPDAFLILPAVGTTNPEGLFVALLNFCQEHGDRHGAKFFLYMRDQRQCGVMARLTRECEHILGVKVGTSAADVPYLQREIGSFGSVLWGVGDCASEVAELGVRGHTSGIALLFARASDEINNAYRRGDFAESRRIEQEIHGFEAIRFMDNRSYNHSAVIVAARQAGFADIECGEGGPFNAPPPAEICHSIALEVEKLRVYH